MATRPSSLHLCMPNISSSLPVTHFTDSPSFYLYSIFISCFPSNRWSVQKARSCAETVHGCRLKMLLHAQEHCVCVCVSACVCVCVCVCSTNRQTSCANKNVDCVRTEMWHAAREEQRKQCFVWSWNYFCSMWEDGSAASQQPGQQKAFVLLADKAAILADECNECDFYGYRRTV